MEHTKADFNDYQETFWGDFSIKHKKSRIIRKRFHIHDHFEVMLILSDNAIFKVADKEYPLAPNTMLLVNNMDLHYLSLKEDIRYNRYVLHFRPEFIEELSSEQTDLLGCFFYRPFLDAQILPLDESVSRKFQQRLDTLQALQDNTGNKEFGFDLETKFLLGILLLEINRMYREYHGIENETSSKVYNLTFSVINYIHKNLNADLSVESLAKSAGTNLHTLSSSFNLVTGISPHQYIIKCRMTKARELLEHGYSVNSVCTQVGYPTLAHFSRAFKRDVGMSPKTYSMQARR